VEYILAYRFVFQSRNWLKNLLWGSLCFLVPILGPMVLAGYLFEVIEWLHRRREEERLPWVEPTGITAAPEAAIQTEPGVSAGDFEYAAPDHYPDFNVNRIQDYLMRGVWPFLVQLVVGLPLAFFIIGLYVLTVLLIGVAVANNVGPFVIVPILLVAALAFLVGLVLMGVIQVPLYLRAGLSRDFGSAFSMAYLKDFLKRTGKEVVLSQLFLHATGIVLGLLGAMACVIGAYPAAALGMMATHHLDYQLYELYLQRGGEPIRPRDDRLGVEKST
jgi:hypothetical protein